MNSIKLISEVSSLKSAEILKEEFEKAVHLRDKECIFVNTEAAITWIIRGGIDYFSNLDSDFLGDGNASGIPSMKADHFANNFYRVSNTLNYLAKLWKFEVPKTKEWNLLSDIRTLIVHSGEQLSSIESLELQGYKDSQLGRIFKNEADVFESFLNEEGFDYRIEIWNDKHDKSKRQENEVDYDNRVENYRDIDIYLNASDVKQIVLSQIEKFINLANNQKIQKPKLKKLPDIKNRVIYKDNIDFDKIENLIKNKKRGDYLIEEGQAIWNGFGLKRFWDYSKCRFGIPKEVSETVQTIIQQRLDDFWEAYNDETVEDTNLPSLNISNVFKDYTPNYKLKNYLEDQKLFGYIAPFFNKKDRDDRTDVDYLLRFISEANKALNVALNLENTVDGIVCDYYLKSVEKKLKEE